MNIIQYKLTSGEEIVAKYVTSHIGTSNILITDVLLIERIVLEREDESGEVVGTSTMFTMVPWFVNQLDDNPNPVTTLNMNNVIAQYIPGETIVQQYTTSLANLKSKDEMNQEDNVYEEISSGQDSSDYPSLRSLIKPQRMN